MDNLPRALDRLTYGRLPNRDYLDREPMMADQGPTLGDVIGREILVWRHHVRVWSNPEWLAEYQAILQAEGRFRGRDPETTQTTHERG